MGFITKGNTCYGNSILQALNTVPILWRSLPSESSSMSPISKATTLNMFIQKKALKPIDQTFCGPLNTKCLVSAIPHLTSTPSRMLLKYWTSVLANDLVSNALRTSITCNGFLCSAAKEEKRQPLLMSNNIKTSSDKLLDSETFSSQNKWFCPSYDTLTESTKETATN